MVACRAKNGVRCQFPTFGTRSFGGLDLLPCSGRTNRKGKAKVWHLQLLHVVVGAIQTAAQEPQHRPVATSPHVVRRNRSSLPLRREFRSSRSVGRRFRARVPGALELSEEGESSRTRRSSWGPVGTVSEIRRTIGEAVASLRRRAREGGQVVGGSETTCRTFAFRVGSGEPTPLPPPSPRFLQITQRNWFS